MHFQKVAVNGENVELDGDQKVWGGIHGGQSPGFWKHRAWDQGDGGPLPFQGGMIGIYGNVVELKLKNVICTIRCLRKRNIFWNKI